MIQHIRESNLIENIDDPNEDAQSLKAWEYLIKRKALTHEVVRQVQRMITRNQTDLAPHEKGYYRDVAKVNVYVGEHIAPSWWLVDGLMANWLFDYKNMTPKEAHAQFEYIHPFVDGNGRTGRMLMWWHEHSLGHEPTLLEFKDRDSYYGWFKK